MNEVHVLVAAENLPAYARPGDAGADLQSTDRAVLAPGERALVGTGVRIALPDGFVGLVHPRSGLAVKHGITVLNTPGTIDAGYRGEIKVILINLSDQEYAIEPGDRIAQLVLLPVVRATLEVVDTFIDSARGAGGFGHTGRR